MANTGGEDGLPVARITVFQAWNCREAQDSPQHSSEHAQL